MDERVQLSSRISQIELLISQQLQLAYNGVFLSLFSSIATASDEQEHNQLPPHAHVPKDLRPPKEGLVESLLPKY